MLVEAGKDYERPNSGTFLGTIVDVVDLGKVTNQFGTKVKIRIIWVLDKNDSEGKPFRVMRQVNATMSSGGKRPSDLYVIVKEVLGVAPPVPFETEELIGRSNKLFIIKEGEYANVRGILPLDPGEKGPAIPADFVRSKDRTDRQPISNGAPAVAQATAATPVPQAQAAAVVAAPAAKADVSF